MRRRLALSMCCLVPCLVVPPGAAWTTQDIGSVPDIPFELGAGRCPAASAGCQALGPKEFTAAEGELVRGALDEIVSRSLGRDLVRQVQRGGGVRIVRFTGPSGPLAMAAAAFRSGPGGASVEIYDRFVVFGDARDEYYGGKGHSFAAQALTHELMHAVDTLSDNPEFLSAVGFVRAGARWRYSATDPDAVTALMRWETERVTLEQRQDYRSLRRLNRELAINARSIGLPSMQAVRSPAEAFAEIGSYLVIDEAAAKHLPDEIVTLFQREVFDRWR